MHKPQVLVFIDWYAPGFKAGGPVRSLVNMVDHLRDRIDFHIVTSDTDYTERDPYPAVDPDRWTTLPGGEKVWYASMTGVNATAWKKLLDERTWDTVYINGMYSRWFSIMPLWLLRGSAQRRVVAVRGMLASGMMRHGTLKKRAFLLLMRLLGCYRDVEFQATNAEEVADVRRWIDAGAIVHLVPNLGRKASSMEPAAREKKPGVLRLVSVARIAVEKNTLFAIERLRSLQGNVDFDLYGPIYDHGYWERCQQVIASLPSHVKVRYLGVVAPDHVPALFADYHALFMPSQGENFGHTMVEALSAGLPLLISDRTPWKGLGEKRAGWDLPLSDPQAFEAALSRLVAMDTAAWQDWSKGAFDLGRRYLTDQESTGKTLRLLAP